ncbi:MAG: tRNA (adenosine(37)-N6)-threonylcarbamoyltransferase complex dimerization subunit type 1 TsaB [Mycobacteriaceae bacterium]
MLVLAMDTATPAVTVGLVEVAAQDQLVNTLASRVVVNARAHAELLTPSILECLGEHGMPTAAVEAVVVGVGPGPFTGLRVGMATAAAFGDALGIPVYGVCTLDAIAVAVTADYLLQQGVDFGSDKELLVVTDARRREVYWSKYVAGKRIIGPSVNSSVDVEVGEAQRVAGSAEHCLLFDLPRSPVESPTPASLVHCALDQLLTKADSRPLVPLYLRRPDATVPKALS